VILWDDVAENEFGILGNGSAHGSGLLFIITLLQMFATELSEPNTYFSDNNVEDFIFVLHNGTDKLKLRNSQIPAEVSTILLLRSCASRKFISHSIKPPTVHNDDVDHRLLEIALSFQALAAVPIAIQDYPFSATGAYASDDNNQNSGSIFVSDDARSTR